MLAVGLALVSALAYGTSDYIGGVLSKSRSSWTVALVAQLVSALVTALLALGFAGSPTAADFGWAAAGGIGEAIGICALYRGLARGWMGIVAPVSGIGATLVPVVVGVATGDQPSAAAWVGIALAFPAVYLIPRAPGSSGSGRSDASTSEDVLTGAVAGLGFGAQFALVGQIGEGSGLFPLALLWLASAATIALVAAALRQPWVPRRGDRLGPVVAFGPISAVAVASFLLATQEGLFTVVAVIAALYPAVTVAMAAAVLRERIGRLQALGLVLAAATVVLVTIGR